MKYYYNTITGEYCGTKTPLGDNFHFTYQEPLEYKEGVSILYDTVNGWFYSYPDNEIEINEHDILMEIQNLEFRIQEHLLMDEKEEAKELVLQKRKLQEELNGIQNI